MAVSKQIVLAFAALGLHVLFVATAAQQRPPMNSRDEVVLSGGDFRYGISTEGIVSSVTPAGQSGNLLGDTELRHFMEVRTSSSRWPATRVVSDRDTLKVTFGDSGFAALIRVQPAHHSISFTIKAFRGPSDASVIEFVRIPVALTAAVGTSLAIARDDRYAAVVLPGDVRTEAAVTPGSGHALLTARADSRIGIVGARAILLLCRVNDIYGRIAEAEVAYGLPHPSLDGIWAKQSKSLESSYLFLADITAQAVEPAIDYAKNGGFGYVVIPDHAWDGSPGSYSINMHAFPNGEADLRTAVDRIHAAGLKAGMHVLAMEVAKSDAFVSPVPAEGLLTYPENRRSLAQSVDAHDGFIPTTQPPIGLNPGETAAYKGRDLRIGDEMITYGSLRTSPPYGYADCRRGAHDTHPSAHAAGAVVDNLVEFNGGYRIDSRSPLYTRVAQRIGQVLAQSKFDFVYPDGYEAIGAYPEPTSWYPQNVFLSTLLGAVKRDVLYAHDPGSSYSWHVFARGNTHDTVGRGIIDSFQRVNLAGMASKSAGLESSELGWFGFFLAGPHVAATEPREVEYAWSKAFAHHAAMSLETSLSVLNSSGNTSDVFHAIALWEKARSAGLPDEVRKSVSDPSREFTILESGKRATIVPVVYQTVALHGCTAAPFDNPFATQDATVRIELAPGLTAYANVRNSVLIDPAAHPQWISDGPGPALGQPWHSVKANLQVSVATAADQPAATGSSVTVTASNMGPDNGWAAVQLVRPATEDLSRRRSLAAWVQGDGSAAYLHFVLQNKGSGLVRDYYTKLDFTGWRYIVMREPARGEVYDFHFPYSSYWALSNFNYGAVWGTYVFLTNIQAGHSATAQFTRLEALEELPNTQPKPALLINGQALEIPFALSDGKHVEATSAGAVLRDANGIIESKATIPTMPVALAGKNQISQRDCSSDASVRVRMLGSPVGSWQLP